MSAGMKAGLPGRWWGGLGEGKNRKEEGNLKVAKTDIKEVTLHPVGGMIEAGELIAKLTTLT